jgi:glutamate carboxypeptidase
LDETLEFMGEHQGKMIENLRAFVESETPSTEKKLLGDFAGFLAGYATEAGGEVEVLPDTVSGEHVRALWDAENKEAPLLLLGHYDTVWSAGTLGTMPFETKDGIATGPGVFDIKCRLVQSFWAVKTAREVLGVHKPIVFLCNSDQEIGSPGSHTLIEEARRAAAVLVLEPSLGGALKTARKRAGRYLVRVTGEPAHAGLDLKGGVSAIEELSSSSSGCTTTPTPKARVRW